MLVSSILIGRNLDFNLFFDHLIVKSVSSKLGQHEKKLEDARNTLTRLGAAEEQVLDGHDSLEELRTFRPVQYYADQWTRQRECQLELMKDESLNDLQLRLEQLIDLEEQLRETL